MAKNVGWLSVGFEESMSVTIVVNAQNGVEVYYSPPGGVFLSPNDRFVLLKGCREGRGSTGFYSKDAQVVDALFPITTHISTVSYTTKEERAAAKAAIKAAAADVVEETPEEAPEEAPKRRTRKAKPAAAKPTARRRKGNGKPSAAANKKAMAAARKRIKELYPEISAAALGTFHTDAVKDGVVPNDADALFGAMVVGATKAQVVAKWDKDYPKLDPPVTSDEWVEVWSVLDGDDDTNYTDFDTVYDAVQDLLFVEEE